MREEFVKFENNISIHIRHATVPPIDPKIPFMQRTELVSDFHLHNEYEFLRINRGVLRCVTLDNEYLLREGDIMFVNKYIAHSTYFENNRTHYSLIQFRLPSESDSIMQYISRFKKTFDISAFVFKKDEERSVEIQKYIQAILHEYNNQEPFWKDYVYNHMLMLITALRRHGILSKSMQNNMENINKIRPILEYINENYADNISTNDLSRMMHFNETYFCRMFKSIVGTSALNYINFVRICKAEKLLEKNVGILEIAHETGFASASYFNRIFKQYNHRSPSEYRKILCNREFEQ
ncbi:MAG: AraC family transcriptional regulator [Clostridia bacterium]|nr:AraC family transcriptional regulator [Clostridia bacterium]